MCENRSCVAEIRPFAEGRDLFGSGGVRVAHAAPIAEVFVNITGSAAKDEGVDGGTRSEGALLEAVDTLEFDVKSERFESVREFGAQRLRPVLSARDIHAQTHGTSRLDRLDRAQNPCSDGKNERDVDAFASCDIANDVDLERRMHDACREERAQNAEASVQRLGLVA